MLELSRACYSPVRSARCGAKRLVHRDRPASLSAGQIHCGRCCSNPDSDCDFSTGVSSDSVQFAPSLAPSWNCFAHWCGLRCPNGTVERLRQRPSNIVALSMGGHVSYLKPVLAGLLASAIVYLCFLTWLHWKAVSFVKEQGATGLIGVTGAQPYVLHSPSFWALAIIAFGVVFFLFRNA